jgi:hypothetical protein
MSRHDAPRNSPLSPRYPLAASTHNVQVPVSSGRPLLLIDTTKDVDGFRGESAPKSAELASSSVRRDDHRRVAVPSPSSRPEGSEGGGWTVLSNPAPAQNITHAIMSSLVDADMTSPALTDDSEKGRKSPEWKDGDFPPLSSRLRMHIEKSEDDAGAEGLVI